MKNELQNLKYCIYSHNLCNSHPKIMPESKYVNTTFQITVAHAKL
jgi:hypothetical protein